MATATSGSTFGGYFASSSTGGRGVYGEANATSGTAYGVYGYNNSADGGAAGFFVADNNAAASNVAGVYGRADGDGAALLPVYGVAGHAYYDGVGVGAWSYGGRIFEGRDGDYPGGALLYMERNGAAMLMWWNTFLTAETVLRKSLWHAEHRGLDRGLWHGQTGQWPGYGQDRCRLRSDGQPEHESIVFLTPLGVIALRSGKNSHLVQRPCYRWQDLQHLF